jgi:multiple sugar transport system substrate-binding protein
MAKLRQLAACAAAGVLVATALAGCASDDGGTPVLTWFAMPDNGGAVTRAQDCAASSGGAYRVRVETLPNDATQQREQLVRRLAAKDTAIDVLSTDVVYTAEFANGFPASVRCGRETEADRRDAGRPGGDGHVEGHPYAAPFKTNTQLLWYRKSLAAAAGVNPESPDFTWDQMIKAAGDKANASPSRARDTRVTWCGSTPWCWGRADTSSPTPKRDARPPRAWRARPARRRPRSSAAWPAPRRGGRGPVDRKEEQARATFQGDNGMFMLNWPYVLAAARSAVEEGTLSQDVVDDIGWARYPRVFPDKPSQPPLGGAEPRHRRVHPPSRSGGPVGGVRQRAAEGHAVHARRG